MAGTIHRSFNPVRVLMHVDDSRSGLELYSSVLVGGSQQRALQVGAMYNEVRSLPALLGHLAKRDSREHFEGACVP